jgi:hypothetical protein
MQEHCSSQQNFWIWVLYVYCDTLQIRYGAGIYTGVRTMRENGAKFVIMRLMGPLHNTNCLLMCRPLSSRLFTAHFFCDCKENQS